MSRDELVEIAGAYGAPDTSGHRARCCVCRKEIKLQIRRNTGVCSELCQKKLQDGVDEEMQCHSRFPSAGSEPSVHTVGTETLFGPSTAS